MSLTNRDPHQITQFEHDNENNAKRVVVVGQEINIDSAKIAESLEKALSNIKVDLSQGSSNKEVQIQVVEIEKQVFVPQIQYEKVEVPVIVKETQIVEVEKIIYIDRMIRVEVPVIVKEIEIREFNSPSEAPGTPMIVKIAAIIHSICVIGLTLHQFFSHIK
jgi:hypothetical protein